MIGNLGGLQILAWKGLEITPFLSFPPFKALADVGTGTAAEAFVAKDLA